MPAQVHYVDVVVDAPGIDITGGGPGLFLEVEIGGGKEDGRRFPRTSNEVS